MDWLPNQTRLFRATLYCYPAEFRHEYGAEMERLFQDRLRSEPRWRLWLDTLTDLAFSAPKEHWDILLGDVKYEARVLAAMPGFSAIVLLVIALGIGATVSIFSLLNAVLLRSWPYGHPAQLMYLWSPNPNFKGVPDEMGPIVADFYGWQQQSRSFSAMALLRQRAVNVVRDGSASRVGAAFVSGNFFQTMQAWPEKGRSLDSNDDQPGHEHVAVVSDEFWRLQFAAESNVIDKHFQMNRQDYRVVGVMPHDFGFPFEGDIPYDHSGFRQTDIWLPAAYSVKDKTDRTNLESADAAIGRLKSGVSVAAAQSELMAIEARFQPLYPEMWKGWTALVKPLVQTIVGPVEKMLWLLLGAVGIVLLIAVSNVAGLLLARATSRAHELGIRTALGAERSRIIRQLLTESLLLSCPGGALGVALAYGLVRVLTGLNPGKIPRFESANIDARVLFLAAALSVATGVAAGLVPAISSSGPNIGNLLRRGGGRLAGGSHRGRFAFVVLEVALSVVLLAGSVLLIRSYIQIEAVDPGFSRASLILRPNLDDRYNTDESQASFYKMFLGKLQTLPGVKYAGASRYLPLSGGDSMSFIKTRGNEDSKEMVETRSVTPDYRQAMGTLLLRGRDFDLHDLNSTAKVVMINAKFADTYFKGRNPLGEQVCICVGTSDAASWSTIVGVVGDVRHTALEEAGKPQIFQPAMTGDSFAIRYEGPTQQVVSEAKAALRSLDPAVTLEATTMNDVIKASNARRTFQTSLLTGFAAVAVVLALVGLYGLMSYTVKQRRGEIGIRLAIGSPRSRVLCLILGQGLQLTGYGLLIGLACAFAMTRLMSAWLFGVESNDPVTFVAVPLFLLAVACCACLIPAWNATRIDPVQTLRQE
jgi:putative ABC transport system permease protein